VTPLDIPAGTALTIYFKEYWPAYQCSVDQTNWSPVLMLDPARVYPDDATQFLPVQLQAGRFPVTDEAGVPTGIYFRLLQTITVPYSLLVTTPAGAAFGPVAVLEMDTRADRLKTPGPSPLSAPLPALQSAPAPLLTRPGNPPVSSSMRAIPRAASPARLRSLVAHYPCAPNCARNGAKLRGYGVGFPGVCQDGQRGYSGGERSNEGDGSSTGGQEDQEMRK
jgi:hypothetical protein